MTRVSVIMPSFLGEYKGSANDRDNKFVRAVSSFVSNDYPLKELIIIGDNCSKTKSLLTELFFEEMSLGTIKFYQFPKKQKLFSGNLRTKGLEMATGDIIMYLDSDDMYGDKHISSIVEQMDVEKLDWCYFNDFIRTDGGLVTKTVELEHASIGTSSIAHCRNKDITWTGCDGYGHDWLFIQRLMDWSNNYDKIFGGIYIICHIPHQVDT